LTAAFFALANIRYSGPVIRPDEVGYLGYAAFLAGYSVDAASSYHLGYSIFLAPLFRILPSTEAIWTGITVVNGAFFGGALAVCYYISKEFFSDKAPAERILVIGLCALYPGWVSISGYAFYQPPFAFFFALSAYLLLKGRYSNACLIGAVASSSFLFWIHALGIVCCVVTVAIIVLLRRGFITTVSAVALSAFVIWIYQFGLAPAVDAAMTPAGVKPLKHYPSVASALAILSPSGVLEFATRMLGQASYLLIATLGFAVRPLVIALSAVPSLLSGQIKERDPIKLASIFAIGSIVGMTVFSAAMFTVVQDASRQDHWMYGRYNEGAILPVLLIGLSIPPKRSLAVIPLLIPIMFAVLVSALAPDAARLAPINSAAFWPAVAFPNLSFSSQVTIGAVASGAVVALASWSIGAVVLAVAFLICLPRQVEWHDMASRIQSKPQLVQLVRDVVSPGSCVALDPRSGFSRLRFLDFYLFEYRLQRVHPSEWRQKCDGPYLSVSGDPRDADWVGFTDWNAKVFGRGRAPTDEYSEIAFADARLCASGWCYARDAELLFRRSQNGQLKNGVLASTRSAGYLFFGPYIKVEKGHYRLELTGSGGAPSSRLEIAADGGKDLIAQFPLSTLADERAEFSFELPRDALDLEVRLYTPAGADIAVSGYVLTKD